jgi:hypothetical protein
MKGPALTLVSIIFLVIFAALAMAMLNPQEEPIETQVDNPEIVISYLYDAIDHARDRGEYNCCIHPACTMCYLGHWKFEKGTCHCDEAIAEGRFDDVCPECRSGIESGQCSSTQSEACDAGT